MKRRRLIIVFIVSLLGIFPLSLSLSAQLPIQSHTLYIPIVQKPVLKPPFAEVIVTVRSSYCWPYYGDEVCDYSTSGYINSLVSEPISATVAIGIGYSNVGEPLYEFAQRAFPVTLPGQSNPFHWSGGGARQPPISFISVSLGSAEIVDPNIEQYYPLTISSWVTSADTNTGTITGTVVNNNPVPLHSATVVVASFPKCDYITAELATTTLLPGQQTTFMADIGNNCLTQSDLNLVIVGQGVGQP